MQVLPFSAGPFGLSNTDGGECVEVCDTLHAPAVRDSKTPDAPALVLRAAAWSSFVTAVRQDELPACRPRNRRTGSVS
ncbi:DUF397 domain-containing protein [Streptomyces sp. ME02-8801-2C]|uniref:DUF397 domain-containing protein n=1 Tax=Streptomyces sp. ME02-8801-2C TaxID=3028680 RepID=UPI0029C0CB0F|nr:DUF397 domain-containing protein [Streptomyces sp. ME02-8801-2C]